MRSYNFLHNIEDDSELAQLLNAVMQKLYLHRLVCAPTTFKNLSSAQHIKEPFMFCESLLWEKWMNDVVERLRSWNKQLTCYFTEYEGKWRYYACSNYREAVNDDLGSDDDYDEHGNPVERELTDEELSGYTIIDHLCPDDWQDIVQSTTSEDLAGMRAALQIGAVTTINDFTTEVYGKRFQMYKKTDEGKFVPMSSEEVDLVKASESVFADDLMKAVTNVCRAVQHIYRRMKKLDKFADNVDELRETGRYIDALLALDAGTLEELSGSTE